MTELRELRAAWDAERADLDRQCLALQAVGQSIGAGHYEQARTLLAQIDAAKQLLEARLAKDERRRERKQLLETCLYKETRMRKQCASERIDMPDTEEQKPTRPWSSGGSRKEREGYAWHNCVNHHTRYRCLKCEAIIDVRVLDKHKCQ